MHTSTCTYTHAHKHAHTYKYRHAHMHMHKHTLTLCMWYANESTFDPNNPQQPVRWRGRLLLRLSLVYACTKNAANCFTFIDHRHSC